MLRLEIRQRRKRAAVFESAKTPLFLGRDPSMDLVLDDPRVSRQHAVITAKGKEHVIQDVGGRNPLRVNRRVVVRHVLTAGDIIVLGDTQIRYGAPAAKSASSKSASSKSASSKSASSKSASSKSASAKSGAKTGRSTKSRAARGVTAEELGSAIVDARETLATFRDASPYLSPDDTLSGSFGEEETPGSSSQRNLRILRNFSELIRNLSDRQKLLESALHAVFDSLEAKCGFIGFFNPAEQLEIVVQRSHGRVEPISYSPTIVQRVRREALAILFSDTNKTDEQGPVSRAAEAGADGASSAGLDSRSVKQLRIQSAMCLPLFRGERVCGILYVDNRGRPETFSQEDLYFANVLSNLISLAVEKEELYEKIHDENIELRTILHQKNRLIGASPALKEVGRKVKKVANFDTTVLITGESGTGKELVARAIHDRSPRRGKPFVAVNCAAIPETLLESELFGYAPQSGISGADPKGKPGKFELADGGTLFLDEIGDMSLSTQAKILRVLEDRVVDRLGGMNGRRVDLRILAATNKVLSKAVRGGGFREDLFYRLKVFQIGLSPLRERREDILPLAQHFLSMHEQEGRGPIDLSPRAKELLLAYHWPGNIRELKHCVEEAVLLSNGRTIYPENMPADLRRDDNPQPFGTLSEVEAQHIRRVLQSVNWNKRRASEMLGINRSTLYEKIRLYEIEKPPDSPERAGEKKGRAASGPGSN